VKPGCIRPRIVSGTNTSGFSPSVVPLKPRGVTPAMVMAWPLMTRVSFKIEGLSSKRVRQ
jgi:hypothetical protein